MKKAQIIMTASETGFLCFTTTNKGGYSEGKYGELNLGEYCGEELEIVRRNRALVCEAIGVKEAHLFVPREVHKDESVVVDEQFLSLTRAEQYERMSQADALITSLPHIAIAVSTADCVPVVVIDKKNKRTAAIHAGWRGIAADIIQKTLGKMQAMLPMDKEQTIAIIGPCIGADSFEVGSDVWLQISNTVSNSQSILKKEQNGKYYVDLLGAAQMQVQKYCGTILANTEDTKTSDRFYSARRDGFASGRFLSGAVIL